MKKKSPRGIPDFSHHGAPHPDGHAAHPQARKPPLRGGPPPAVKPKATSAKSGRRGQ